MYTKKKKLTWYMVLRQFYLFIFNELLVGRILYMNSVKHDCKRNWTLTLSFCYENLKHILRSSIAMVQTMFLAIFFSVKTTHYKVHLRWMVLQKYNFISRRFVHNTCMDKLAIKKEKKKKYMCSFFRWRAGR